MPHTEQVPFGLGVFHFPHIVLVPSSTKIKAFSRRFFGSPANPRILNVRFSYSSVLLSARFSIFSIEMLRPSPHSQSKRNKLYALLCVGQSISPVCVLFTWSCGSLPYDVGIFCDMRVLAGVLRLPYMYEYLTTS